MRDSRELNSGGSAITALRRIHIRGLLLNQQRVYMSIYRSGLIFIDTKRNLLSKMTSEIIAFHTDLRITPRSGNGFTEQIALDDRRLLFRGIFFFIRIIFQCIINNIKLARQFTSCSRIRPIIINRLDRTCPSQDQSATWIAIIRDMQVGYV